MHLNRSRPHAQVYGEPGVSWQQDGRWFRFDGSPVPETAPEAAPETGLEPEPAPAAKAGSDDLRLSENKRLKAQLDIYGEPWTTAAAARRFLEGLGT